MTKKTYKEMSVKIVLDYSNINDDFKKSLVNIRGKQDIMNTLQNHIDILMKSVQTLELIKDSLYDDEPDSVELGISIMDNLEIKGDPEIIERFIGFGIAEYNSDSDSDEEIETETETDDSDEIKDSKEV
jgi:hypothetical protein